MAAILALTQLLENSTGEFSFRCLVLRKACPNVVFSSATTLTGLLMELTQGRKKLVETQPSLGVRAGCQLFERFVGASGAGEVSLSIGRMLAGVSVY